MDANNLLYFVIILQIIDTFLTVLCFGLMIDLQDSNSRIYRR